MGPPGREDPSRLHVDSDPPFGEPLGTDWYVAQARVRDLLDAARARVVIWKWGRAESALEDPRPLLTERESGFAPRLLDRRPAQDCRRYGLDADGLIVLAEDVEAGPSGDAVTWAAFWLEQNDGTRVLVCCQVHANGTPVLWSLIRAQEHHDGRLDHVDLWYGPSGRFIQVQETYEYTDGHLSAITKSWPTRDGTIDGEHFAIARDGDHDVLRISYEKRGPDRPSPDRPLVVFRRTRTPAVKAAKRHVLSALPELVAAWIDRVAPDKPCWALFVVYAEGEHLPDGLSLALATHAERSALATPDNRDAIWNPADYSTFDVSPPELRHPEFADAWGLVVSDMAATERPVRDLAVACARQLRNESTVETHPQTKSALVVPLDVELVDIDANLRAMKVTAATRRQLEGRA